MKQWNMNRVESSNAVCAENTEKRLELHLDPNLKGGGAGDGGWVFLPPVGFSLITQKR